MVFSRFKVLALPVLALLFLGLAPGPVQAELNKKKVTTLGLYMTAKQAAQHVEVNAKKTLFVDVRTAAELTYLGTPAVTDAHVPYQMMDPTKWDEKKHVYKHTVNKNFVADITERLKKKGLTKNDTVILMCRSGSRSKKGVDLLAAAGFTKVYNVIDGYEGDKSKTAPTKGKRTVNGWKNSGLPWTYSLDKDIMYFPK